MVRRIRRSKVPSPTRLRVQHVTEQEEKWGYSNDSRGISEFENYYLERFLPNLKNGRITVRTVKTRGGLVIRKIERIVYEVRDSKGRVKTTTSPYSDYKKKLQPVFEKLRNNEVFGAPYDRHVAKHLDLMLREKQSIDARQRFTKRAKQ